VTRNPLFLAISWLIAKPPLKARSRFSKCTGAAGSVAWGGPVLVFLVPVLGLMHLNRQILHLCALLRTAREGPGYRLRSKIINNLKRGLGQAGDTHAETIVRKRKNIFTSGNGRSSHVSPSFWRFGNALSRIRLDKSAFRTMARWDFAMESDVQISGLCHFSISR
jgi:hypothetical protein